MTNGNTRTVNTEMTQFNIVASVTNKKFVLFNELFVTSVI
jgi:hypothetical protein